MKFVNIRDFGFTRSFVFLHQLERVKRKKIRHILTSIRTDAKLENVRRLIVRHRVELGGNPPTYGSVSFLLGETVRSPTFANGTLQEHVLAYLLLIEAQGYAAMQLRHLGSSDVSPLLEVYRPVSYSQLTSVLTNNANILKIVSKIINPTQSGLTGRSYEGNSLQNEMPQYGSGKAIPRSLKASDHGGMISVTAGAGRITQYGQAVNVDQLGHWFAHIHSLFEANGRSAFLARFAEPVDFKTAIAQLGLSLVVFDVLGLQRKIAEEGLIWRRKYKKKSQRKLTRPKATPQMIDHVIRELSKNAIVNSGQMPLGEVVVTGEKIKLELGAFRHFTLFDGRKDYSLSTYINNKELFSVYFDKPDHVYMGGGIYRDSGIIGEAQSVISALTVVTDLTSADREKIDLSRDQLHPNKAALTDFPASSVFAIAEKHCASATYVFCDDLGDEWADHISICAVEKKLTFIHSKHGKPTTGASSLHEVVGQALKNMGNLLCMPAAMKAKIAGYSVNYVGTNIPLIRRFPAGETIPQIETNVVQILSNNDLRREAILCCSFLSENEVTKQLTSLMTGKQVRPHIRQLLWLLSYFVGACREVNVVPRILCGK